MAESARADVLMTYRLEATQLQGMDEIRREASGKGTQGKARNMMPIDVSSILEKTLQTKIQ